MKYTSSAMRMRNYLWGFAIVLLILASVLVFFLWTDKSGPVAYLSHGGYVRGSWFYTDDGAGAGILCRRFLGIPYAAPPVGELRFQPPEPALPWTGERLAKQEGHICPQPPSTFVVTYPGKMPAPDQLLKWLLHLPQLLTVLFRGVLKQDEDCLSLNVYAPQMSQDSAPLGGSNLSAVLVWLHGGGFLIGDGTIDEYGPELLVHEGITVVTLNYRLGVLGFLYGGPDSGAPGNAGLRDQVQALQWIRKNIAEFGGDPARVTLWGESAGAVSSHLHTMANAPPLFSQVILSSGSALLPWTIQERPMEALVNLAKRLKLEQNSPQKIVQLLKQVPAKKLALLSQPHVDVSDTGTVLLPWLPVVEESSSSNPFLTIHPLDAMAHGDFKALPMMTGVNSREGMLWLVGKSARTVRQILRYLNDNFHRVLEDLPLVRRTLDCNQTIIASHRIRKFFFKDKPLDMQTLPEFLDRRNAVKFDYLMPKTPVIPSTPCLQLYSDLLFNIGAREFAALHLKWFSSTSTPLYLYQFSFDGKLGFLKRLIGTTVPGAAHADELGYLFRGRLLPPLELPDNSPEIITRKRLIRLWTNFVKYGNPTPINDLIKWKPISPTSNWYLNIEDELQMEVNMFAQRSNFWKDIYNNVLQTPVHW